MLSVLGSKSTDFSYFFVVKFLNKIFVLNSFSSSSFQCPFKYKYTKINAYSSPNYYNFYYCLRIVFLLAQISFTTEASVYFLHQ